MSRPYKLPFLADAVSAILCAAVFLLTVCRGEGPTWAGEPTITRVSPRVLTPGKSLDVEVSGSELTGVADCYTSCPVQVMSRWNTDSHGALARARLQVDKSVTPGLATLRLHTVKGVSNPLVVVVDTLPYLAASGKHHHANEALQVGYPSIVSGQVKPQRQTYLQLKCEQPLELSVDILAARLNSPLDPVIVVADENGRVLARADDTEGLGEDCQLTTRLVKPGTYTIGIRDSRYAGGDDFIFVMRLGALAFVRSVYPVGIQQETSDRLEVELSNRKTVSGVSVSSGASDDPTWLTTGGAAGRGAGWLALVTSQMPELREHEPNNESFSAQFVAASETAVNGRIDSANDVDVFALNASANDSIQVRPVQGGPGLPTRVFLRLRDQTGAVLRQAAQAGSGAAGLVHSFESAGRYYIEVQELYRRGGSQYAYRLELTRNPTRFTLQTDRQNVNTQAGRVERIPVKVIRNGYEGVIHLRVSNAPPGTVVTENTVAADKSEANLRIRWPSHHDAQLSWIQIVGYAEVDGKPDEARPVIAHLATAWRQRFRGAGFPPAQWVSHIALGTDRSEASEPVHWRLSNDRWWMPAGEAGFRFQARLMSSVNASGDCRVSLEGIGEPISLAPKGLKPGEAVEFSLRGLTRLEPGSYPLSLVATLQTDAGEFDAVQPVSLRVGDPISISLATDSTWLPGNRYPLIVRVERHDESTGDVQLGWPVLPVGVRVDGPGVIPADRDSVVCTALVSTGRKATGNIELSVSATVRARPRRPNTTARQSVGELLGLGYEGDVVVWEAESYKTSNAVVDTDSYGKEIGIVSDPGAQKNFIEYEVSVPQSGQYQLELRYAAKSARPGRFYLNGDLAKSQVFAQVTGGWYPTHQVWHQEGVFIFQDGVNVLRFECEPLLPHLDKMLLSPVVCRQVVEASFDSWVVDGSENSAEAIDGNLVSVFASDGGTGARRVGLLRFAQPDGNPAAVAGAYLALGVDGRDGRYAWGPARSKARILRTAKGTAELNYAAYQRNVKGTHLCESFGSFDIGAGQSRPAGSYERSKMASEEDLKQLRAHLSSGNGLAFGLEAAEDGSGTARDWGANDRKPKGTHGGPLPPRLVLVTRQLIAEDKALEFSVTSTPARVTIGEAKD